MVHIRGIVFTALFHPPPGHSRGFAALVDDCHQTVLSLVFGLIILIRLIKWV